MEILIRKKELRKHMFEKRNALAPDWKAAYDTWINQELLRLIAARGSRVVHAYIPMLTEIDIRPLLQELLQKNILVICPKTLPRRKLENRVLYSLAELEMGIMGTRHPVKPEIYSGLVDLIITPGMAFDKHNYRLGYGGGYYDNFIVTQPAAYKVGIFYPFQEVEQVPIEPHDSRLDNVLVKRAG